MSKFPLAAVLLVAAPVFAQQSGVSNPPEAEADIAPAATTSAAPVPVVSAPVLVVPATAAPAAGFVPATAPTVTDESPAVTLKHRDLASFDPDARIVGDDMYVNPNEVAAGTLLHARLQTSVETTRTQPGAPFRAEITESVMRDGRVIVPAGSVLEGQVTEIRGGRRLHGPALIHLQAQAIVLPDGSRMPVHASVVDTNRFADTRIDSEGNIVGKGHPAQTLATFSLAAGSAAVAGGLIAGVPGALVGAGIGAGVSTVMWLKADRQTQLQPDTMLVLALDAPLPIQPLVREPEYSAVPARQSPMAAQAAPVQAEPQAFVPLQ